MKLIPITLLTLYTVFTTVIFLHAAEYWYAGLYFIVCVVIWFKLKKRLT